MSLLATLRRPAAAIAAVVLAGSVLAACSGDGPSQISATPLGTLIPVGDRVTAANVGGTLVGGKGTAYLKSEKGHPVIVDFWASWCGPCKVETPALDTVYRNLKSTGVRALGFDTKDPGTGGAQFISQQGISFPMVSDEEGKAILGIANVPATSLPVTILIDKHQRIAAVYVIRYTGKDIQRVMAMLAAES